MRPRASCEEVHSAVRGVCRAAGDFHASLLLACHPCLQRKPTRSPIVPRDGHLCQWDFGSISWSRQSRCVPASAKHGPPPPLPRGQAFRGGDNAWRRLVMPAEADIYSICAVCEREARSPTAQVETASAPKGGAPRSDRTRVISGRPVVGGSLLREARSPNYRVGALNNKASPEHEQAVPENLGKLCER